MDGELAVEVLVTGVLGVDRHGGIPKHGLGTRGGTDDLLLAVDDLVRELEEEPDVDLVLVPRDADLAEGLHLEVVDLEL